MPSWWRRNSCSVTQQDNQERLEDRDEKKFKNKKNSTTSAIRNNNKKKEKYREKQKSLDESELFTHNSLRKSLHLKTSSVSFCGSSAFLGFDSITGNEIVEKKAYPLPRPSSPYEPRIKFNEKLVRFGSVRNLYSSRVSTLSSPSSSSSSSTSDGENDDGALAVACDHGDFGSFRAVEESKLNSWSRTSFSGSGLKASTALTSLGAQQPRDASLDSPSGKQEKIKHPCHPLPLPPVSPTTSSKNLDSKWKKGKLLGSGTFGHVYAGFNSENGQMCAIKEVRVISDDHSSNECLKQLNQEISLLGELSHPNIVQYYGSNLRGDELSVYLEYVSGGSIRKLLGEYGPFAEPVIQSYTKQILSGLAYLHGRNTVHRDIKGANILVDPNGEIKLADFGMAKHITSFSSMLSLRGSPYWMAPEVIINTGGQSLAVDIWSLGCTILEMATSKPPWSQYEGVAAIFKIANCKDYPEIPNYLSEDAQSFVKLCLQREPSARPTAAQLLHHPFIQNQDTREVASSYQKRRCPVPKEPIKPSLQ